eukprot:2681609-Pyramimonas_sp.AAC.1
MEPPPILERAASFEDVRGARARATLLPPILDNKGNILIRTCAVLKQEPHVAKGPASILEAAASVSNERARR